MKAKYIATVFVLWSFVLQLKAWDFEYTYQNVFSDNALDYVVEETNIARYDEGNGTRYWRPIANDTEARLTMRFPFQYRTTRAFLKAYISLYGGTGSLWGSLDGTNWVLLLEAILLGNGAYETNLPPSLLGGKEIWIQGRIQGSGAQLLRNPVGNPNSVFGLQVAFGEPLEIEVAAVRLIWFAEENVTYDVQWSSQFQDWTNVTSITGVGARTNFIDAVQDNKRFYRLLKR